MFCRYKIGATKDGPLVSGSVHSFIEQLGARTSAPGGGSASALVATVVSGSEGRSGSEGGSEGGSGMRVEAGVRVGVGVRV